MYKSGLAGTHISMKCDHLFISNNLPEPGCRIFYVIQFICYVHRAKIFGDLQQGLEDYQLHNWQGRRLAVNLQQNLQQVFYPERLENDPKERR